MLSLPNGGSKTFNFVINLPKGRLADGTDTIYGVVVDPTNAFAQSSPGPTGTVHPPIITLSETENILKLPDATTAGVKFSVKDLVAITNSGTDASTDTLTIGIYATPDGIPAHGSLMTSVTRKPKIGPCKTVTVPVTIGGIPALGVGTYKLVTQVTQANGDVTTTDPLTAPIVTVAKPTTGISFSDTIKTATPTYIPEQLNGSQETLASLLMTMSITNTGSAASGEDHFNLFASASPTFDSSAVQIGGTLTLSLGLIPHKGIRNFNIQFNTTADLNDFSGTEIDRFIFVQVIDPTGNATIAALGITLKVAGPIA